MDAGRRPDLFVVVVAAQIWFFRRRGWFGR
jgi:hypothetical protein